VLGTEVGPGLGGMVGATTGGAVPGGIVSTIPFVGEGVGTTVPVSLSGHTSR
jgi:hypothetical protein